MSEHTEKLECLRYLSQEHRLLHHRRQAIEQRVHLTTLALYILAAFAALKGELSSSPPVQVKVAIWLAFLILGLLSILYLRRIHRANRINIHIAEAAEDEMLSLIGAGKMKAALKHMPVPQSGKFTSWWWQLATILAAAPGSAYVVTIR